VKEPCKYLKIPQGLENICCKKQVAAAEVDRSCSPNDFREESSGGRSSGSGSQVIPDTGQLTRSY